MNLLLHIVAKDFRGLRDRWIYWIGAMAIKTAAALWLVWGRGVDETAYEYVCKSLLVLVPTEVALTFLLAAMIVQADPLVGEPAFWRTRPVSGLRMLAAKMLSLFLLLGLPVCVVALPWWLACGAGAMHLASAAALMLVMQAIVIAPAVLVASLTDSLGRFLVWSLVLVMAHVVGGLLGPLAIGRTAFAGASLTSARLLAYFAVMVTTGAIVVVLQYLLGKRLVSLTVLTGGWIAAVTAWLWWPSSVDFGEWSWARGNSPDVTKVQLAVDGGRIALHSLRPSSWSTYGTLYTRLHVSGAPEGAYLIGRRSEHVWRWPDGSELRRSGWGASNYGVMIDRVRRELRLPEPADEAARRAQEPGADELNVGLTLPRDRMEKMRTSPARYELALDLVAMRPLVAQEVPLQVAGWRTRHGRGVRVLQLSLGGPKLMGTLNYLEAELPKGIADWLRTPFAGTGPDYGAATLFWVDRATGRLKPLGPYQTAIRWPVAGVTLSLPRVSVDPSNLRDAEARGLTLVWVEWEYGVPFTRRATVERFEVK